ncbi:MAG: hypothetical protein PHO02_02635 [Candidatus Nanoarchaeia archaeon]|nr:hypothetical protein [Candidatus Nanoarchaeia archaeon]
MKTLTAIVGAIALASFGCGDDDYVTADADIDTIGETTPKFVFEGEAAYCSHVTESPVRVTCLDIYADMNIKADNKLVTVYSNIICEDKNRPNADQSADSAEFLYQTHLSLCMRDVVVNGVELTAEDEQGNQGIYSMQEDCARIEELTRISGEYVAIPSFARIAFAEKNMQ